MAKGDKTEALEALGIDSICEKIISGDSYLAIAQEVGVSIALLSAWLASDPERSARAREARLASAATFDELAENEIRQAADPFSLARAKELAHHYRWRAAKRNPGEFSERVQQEIANKAGESFKTEAKVSMGADEAYKAMLG